MTWKQTVLAAASLLALSVTARAALEYRTGNGDTLGGAVMMMLNGAGVPVAVSSTSGLPAGTGTYLNGGIALSSSPAQVFAASARIRVKLINYSGIGAAGNAVVMWCRWNATPAPGGAGSFALPPNGGGIDDQGAGVNQNALNCLAESGTPTLYAEQY